jgi:hypothetical protein
MKKNHMYLSIGIATLFLFATAFASVQQTTGDRLNVSFSDPSKPGILEVYVESGSITVKGYTGKDVIITTSIGDAIPSTEEEQEEEIPEKAKGMKRITANRTGMVVEEENNEMTVYVRAQEDEVNLDIQVPVRTSLKLNTNEDGDLLVENVTGEIEASNSDGNLTLNNISGSAVAHAYDGELVVTFNQIDPGKPMSFSAYDGDIDVTFPSTVKATVMIKVDEGDIYSDFEIDLQAAPRKRVKDERDTGGRYRISFGEYVTGTINGGGPEIQFVSYDGDVYIRKK